MLEEIVGQLEGHMASLGAEKIQSDMSQKNTRDPFFPAQFGRAFAFFSSVHMDINLVRCKVSLFRSLNPCFGCWCYFITDEDVRGGNTVRQLGQTSM